MPITLPIKRKVFKDRQVDFSWQRGEAILTHLLIGRELFKDKGSTSPQFEQFQKYIVRAIDISKKDPNDPEVGQQIRSDIKYISDLATKYSPVLVKNGIEIRDTWEDYRTMISGDEAEYVYQSLKGIDEHENRTALENNISSLKEEIPKEREEQAREEATRQHSQARREVKVSAEDSQSMRSATPTASPAQSRPTTRESTRESERKFSKDNAPSPDSDSKTLKDKKP